MIKKLFKIFALLAFSFLCIVFFSSCEGNSFDGVAEAYLNAFTRFDYEEMYSMLTPGSTESATYDEFVTYHKKVYDTLKVKTASYTLGNYTDYGNYRIYNYSTVFDTVEYGQLSYDMELTVYKKTKYFLVSWSPANVIDGMDWNYKIYSATTNGKRGEIFDRDGRILVKNDYALTVYASKASIEGTLEHAIANASLILNIDEGTLNSKYKSNANGIFAEIECDKLDGATLDRLRKISNISVTETDNKYNIAYVNYGNALELFSQNASNRIAQILDKDASELKKSFDSSTNDTGIFLTVFKASVTNEQKEQILNIDNVKINTDSITPIRYYPYGNALAQLLGYSTPVTSEDREKDEYKYIPEGTRVGRSGIEAAYDSYLQPQQGKKIYLISDDSKTKVTLYEEKAKNGYDLVLTVDILLQKNITDYMTENYAELSTGTATVVNPQTGAVVTLVSYPTYDANVFAYDLATDFGDLFTNEKTPLYNRNVQGLYPPGSIFKSIMACIGIESNTVSTSTPFPYENQIEFYTYEKDRWRPQGSNWSNYIVRQAFRGSASGTLDMYRALTWSDNIYFGWLAMTVGKEKVISYAERLGIGESIPFDLRTGKSQLANSYDTLSRAKLLADTGFGQAEVLFTPLQLCCTFSMFGNNGAIQQPYVVAQICDTNENGEHYAIWTAEQKVYRDVFSTKTILAVREILENTAKNGTGKSGTRTVINTMRIASKTGTAETGTTSTGEVGWYAGLVISGGEQDAVLVSSDESDLKFGCVRYVFELLRDE